MINRALGVLIEDGHHPDHVHDELHRQAAIAHLELLDYAAAVTHRPVDR